MEIGKIIKELRFEQKISQITLANALNVKQSTVSKWENGAIIPTADKIVLLAKFFKVTSDYLLSLE